MWKKKKDNPEQTPSLICKCHGELPPFPTQADRKRWKGETDGLWQRNGDKIHIGYLLKSSCY